MGVLLFMRFRNQCVAGLAYLTCCRTTRCRAASDFEQTVRKSDELAAPMARCALVGTVQSGSQLRGRSSSTRLPALVRRTLRAMRASRPWHLWTQDQRTRPSASRQVPERRSRPASPRSAVGWARDHFPGALDTGAGSAGRGPERVGCVESADERLEISAIGLGADGGRRRDFGKGPRVGRRKQSPVRRRLMGRPDRQGSCADRAASSPRNSARRGGNMPVEQVGRAGEIPGRRPAPVRMRQRSEDLQRIGVDDHAATLLCDAQGKADLGSRSGPAMSTGTGHLGSSPAARSR